MNRRAFLIVGLLASACGPNSPGTGSTGAIGSNPNANVGATTPTPTGALDLPATPYNYARPDLPPSYVQPAVANLDNAPSDNPVTDDGATLGRVLFYDRALSQNRSIACASCHRPEVGFADAAPFSGGFAGGVTKPACHGPHQRPVLPQRAILLGRTSPESRSAGLDADPERGGDGPDPGRSS